MAKLRLERAREEDIPFAMATERLPGYEELIGRWDEARHRAAIADPAYGYFIARAEDKPIGFGILRGWDAPDGITLVQKIAVATPGQGHGKAFLSGLIDAVFGETSAYRLWIGLFPENIRARRAYEGAGFREEGIARGGVFFKGTHRDELRMSILRPEWAERASTP